jgi:dihydrofolate reductase
MRKVIYHVATTVDGFIAREDGSWDFFPQEGEHVDDYVASLASYDAVLMGRGTYEVGLKFGVTNPYPSMASYVVSRSMAESPDPAVRLVSGDVAEFVRGLKSEDGRDIYLCGGGDLAAQLLEAGLVDEIKVKLNPVLLGGSGISVVAGLAGPRNLELLDAKVYGSGVVLLTYGVR